MATVQSTVDTGHEDMVHDAQMDYYGTRLATCSSDKLVKIFEVKDGTQVTFFLSDLPLLFARFFSHVSFCCGSKMTTTR